MRGLLILPLNYSPSTPYPLIVDIHGGGPSASIYLKGGILVKTPLEWQLWSAKGYAVFIPEFRSSAAFGYLPLMREYRSNLIDCDIQDIVAGIDSLIAKGIADYNRVALIGHSAGGRRVNWAAVSTHRFQAIVSKEGWADEWFTGGIHWTEKDGRSVPEEHQINSCLFHALGASTPTLFLMGNPRIGGIDPYDTVLWLHHALQAQKVETQYIRYPDEGHVLMRNANKRDALQRVEKWIDDHMKTSTNH